MAKREQITALARRAQAGSKDAFNELYLLTRDRAYFVAFSITKDEQDALDILQDSYLKAWQGIGSLQNPEQFPSWLHQITGNTAKDYIKQRKPQLFQPGAEDETDILELQAEKDTDYIPDAAMDTEETRRLIMDIVDDLPEDQRLCILMYYYDDMPLQDIAAALEIPYSTAMSRLALGRKKISRGVEELERLGTKLYGAAPIPLLAWVLRGIAIGNSNALPPIILGGTALGTAATGGIVAGIALPKIIAGITTVAVIAGGAVAATKISRRPEPVDFLPANAVVAEAAETPESVSEHPVFSFGTWTAFDESQTYGYTRPSFFDGAYGTAATHVSVPDATQAEQTAAASTEATTRPVAGTTAAITTAQNITNTTQATTTTRTTAAPSTTAVTTQTTIAATTTRAPTITPTTTSTTTTTTSTTATTTTTTTVPSGPFAGGNGTQANPYQVSTPAQLNQVRNYTNKYFIQVNDIDMTYDTDNPAGAFYNGGKGWVPIEGDFTGGYNGDGYKITGLKVISTIAGLFGYNNGLIENLALIDVNIKGGASAGGIAGVNWGSMFPQSPGRIERCYTTGTISAEDRDMPRAGGIAGLMQGGGTISDCYSTASVSSVLLGPVYAGNYYAHAGGIVGLAYNRSITNCYSAGVVTGSVPSPVPGWQTLLSRGGLVGTADPGGTNGFAITSSYCLNRINTFGTQLTPAQMQNQANYIGWDFDTVWAINPSINGGLPYLRVFTQ